MNDLAHLVGGFLALPSAMNFYQGYRDSDSGHVQQLSAAFFFGVAVMFLLRGI